MTATEDLGAFQPKQIELEYRLPPTFESVEAERLHRKQRLAGAIRLFGRYGFGEGVAGHLTVRDPEHPDHFWVNPFGMSFRQVKVSDLICVNHDGDVVIGRRPVNAAAFAIHSQIHAGRPDVIAACHSHSIHGRALSSLHQLVQPYTQDSCAFYEDHALLPDFGGVVLDTAYGRKISETLGDRKALIHANHGLITVGHSIEEAAWWFITMERTCQVQLMAQAAGTPIPITPEMARLTRDVVGSHLAGWFSFQPLWDEIVAMEPDLFD